MTDPTPELSIVLPVYNEGEAVESVLRALSAGVKTHDPTNNFKLYRRSFLEANPIESTAGFELALELTVKATIARRPVAEVPTTWRDRTAGQSNFKLRKWLPHYLRWYWVALSNRLPGIRRR